MSKPSDPHPAFNSYPNVPEGVEEYFWAYLNMKSRASSFSGTLTWSDIDIYHRNVVPHLRWDLLREFADFLEGVDEKIKTSNRDRQERLNKSIQKKG